MGRLSDLFAPDTVAVIGATDREGAVGRAILENLQLEFDGEVVPINPNRDEILGLECYPAVECAPPVDLAVVVVPPPVVLESIEELGEAGTENVVVITAGFSETGSEGAEREQQLRELAEEYDLNVVGPNSLGIMSTPVGMNATFGPESATPGSISFMSQSGAFITAVLDWANEQGIGFRDVVSLGNKAVLDEGDFVRQWGEDPETDVVIGYLEGIDDGDDFVRAAREVTDETPIVLVKSGRTDAGAQAASSHTGAIAGSERAYEAGLEQAGVLRASSVQELFDYARALSGLPEPESDGVAVVTNAGGPGVLTTDAIGDSTLEMADFIDETIDRLGETMPDEANVYNPIDAIGDADVSRFADALEIALDDPNVGAAVVVSAPTAVLQYDKLAEVIIENREAYDKPVVACLMGGERARAAEEVLREFGIPNYFDPSRAIAGLDALARYRDVRERTFEDPPAFDVDRERAREILARAEGRDDNRLGVESMDLLEAYGIPTPDGEIVDDPERAREVAESIEGDVVMKIVSPDISHKSDIGGVKVGVPTDEVYDAYEDVVSRARNYQPDATIFGVQVQEMVDLEGTTETIVGMNRDPQFGPLLLFGLGGIFVEILEDTSVRVAPIDENEAAEMVEEIQAAPLLRGARGRDPADVDAVVETILRLSQLVTDFPAILELDVNPLVAGPDGVQAIDLRLTVDTANL
ncbi:acetate--CoA ligase family protein [Natrarchaeobaculum sulfurireducens]|uniref:acetate--CoA ligase (ADP-forming) n=1 Tax=Natrarchaeobaculum sulfurireducens TaxID=2044521 RepID=A0A346PQM0_9EURY|nr:acetate--CoA ligase [Natrarchaeobaculum sulfurireducens]AXR78196.1 Acyl-CoA synthetase, ATP-grasp containing subunit [Natrarchaeobaculum sulfurireducens]AXR81815.1 Acetyl-CoA synthetase (ADP-forming) alpha and beta chains [Natrarchaeobaculum sulfurireducens]